MTEQQQPHCKHCGEQMQKLALPPDTGFDELIHWVCFNDGCSYYREGWDWMWEQYHAKASYRYRIEPRSGNASPLPVWSDTAMRDKIVQVEE